MQRQIVFCGDGHLYFQRTVPSRVSSTIIPEFRSSWRISSERLKSRRFLAALRSSISCSIFSAIQARWAGAEAEFTKSLIVVIGEDGKNRVKFFQSGDEDRRVLLQELAAVHRGVHVAHQIENARPAKKLCSNRPRGRHRNRPELFRRAWPFADWSRRRIARFSAAPQNCAGVRRNLPPGSGYRR